MDITSSDIVVGVIVGLVVAAIIGALRWLLPRVVKWAIQRNERLRDEIDSEIQRGLESEHYALELRIRKAENHSETWFRLVLLLLWAFFIVMAEDRYGPESPVLFSFYGMAIYFVITWLRGWFRSGTFDEILEKIRDGGSDAPSSPSATN